MAVVNQKLAMPPYYDEPLATWDNPLLRYDDPRTAAEILNSNPTETAMIRDIVLELEDLTVPQLIARLRAISAGIAAETAYASLLPEVTLLNGMIDALEASQTALINAQNAVPPATMNRNDKQTLAVEKMWSLLPALGELTTDDAQLEAIGLRRKSKPSPRPVPAKPTGLELAAGDEEGEVSGQCNGQPGVVDYYEIQHTQDDPNGANPNWVLADTAKKSRFELSGLPTGVKIWVRLRAVNAKGKSPWCDPATCRVP